MDAGQGRVVNDGAGAQHDVIDIVIYCIDLPTNWYDTCILSFFAK